MKTGMPGFEILAHEVGGQVKADTERLQQRQAQAGDRIAIRAHCRPEDTLHLGPAIVAVVDGIFTIRGVIEDFFLVALIFRELVVVIAPRVLTRAHDRVLDRLGLVKETGRFPPGGVDQFLRHSVIDDLEEAPFTAGAGYRFNGFPGSG